MLKISITETARETRWVLQGRVFGPWVSELSAIWRTSTRTRKGRACIVDLDAVTFIDKGAEKLLRTMATEGAQFIANGLYIRNVLLRQVHSNNEHQRPERCEVKLPNRSSLTYYPDLPEKDDQ